MSDADFLYRDLEEQRSRGVRLWVLVVVGLFAVLFQVYAVRFFAFLRFLEMPLLVVVYFGLMRRSPTQGMLIGASVGLVQDSLSNYPLGMYGIVKTLVGYFAGSVGTRFDVEHPTMRFILALAFLVFHDFLYWVLRRALLGEAADFDTGSTLLVALLNAIVGISFFHVLDKMKERP
jgi:rod shape-determining protein MreD